GLNQYEKGSKLACIHKAFKLLTDKSGDWDRRSGNDRRMQLAELDNTKRGARHQEKHRLSFLF
ncbi:hypothetical protein P9850_13110, partial [Anoxybacillus rupiensis]|nr:hypothetical protein [Anoxybacillus rupiensis]